MELTYDCDFTTGEHPVRIHVTGAYPDTGIVGRPVQPGRVTARVTLPPAALDGLLPEGTSALSATVSLTALVTQGTRAADVRVRCVGGAAGGGGPESGANLPRDHRATEPTASVAPRRRPFAGTRGHVPGVLEGWGPADRRPPTQKADKDST
ncbi:DUF6801 domain-containing protein [Streptomyces sp. t39]|uniref:DUF6801 domain-containing protein n=1 Tax=Streptomyces sp. t39 TaxID=1828156 RepID=UPI0012CBCFD3|nr:DUF6801 domain-containing protein [Streptomyces sp. t39]TXS47822.1 hypothetical protein EAO77_31485 [Streptomyces sp. t39]